MHTFFLKKNLVTTLFLSLTCFAFSQAVGINNANPAASSILDITSTSRGFLAPRMTSAQRNAIAAPANGLLVFDTDLGAFYYYDTQGTPAWRPLLASSKSTGLAGWSTLGNAGTLANTNFIGTTDAVDLVFRTSNTERLRVYSNNGLLISAISTVGTANTGLRINAISGGSTSNYNLHLTGTAAASTNYSLYNDADAQNYLKGKTGIGTLAPNTQLDVTNDVAVREVSITLGNNPGDVPDQAIGNASFVVISGPTSNYGFTGFAGGVNGKMLMIFNNTTQDMRLRHDDNGSIAANRIWCDNHTDLTIRRGGGCILMYSAIKSRWVVVSVGRH